MRLVSAAVAALFSLPAAALLLPATAAASTIYTYTGQSYSSANLPYTTGESVTGSFTLATALAANLQGSSVAPVSFSFSDGVQTVTDTTALNSLFSNLFTDANGNLTGYSIQINTATLGFVKLNKVSGGLSGDSVRLSAGTGASNTVAGSFQTSPGSATAVTPEPSGLMLLGTGCLSTVAMLRRRRV